MRRKAAPRPVSLGRVLLLGAGAAAAALVVNIAWSLASSSSTLLRWWAIPVAGVIGAGIGALDQARRPTLAVPEGPTRLQLTPRPPSRWEQLAGRIHSPGGSTATAALVVVVGVFGLGGSVAAAAGHYAMNWLTGHESGSDRLVHDAHRQVLGLGITVTSLVQTPHFTRAYLEIDNQTGSSVTIPVDDGNVLLVGGDGTTTRRALAFQSDWNEDIAVNHSVHGVITFSGRLPRDTNRARLTILHLFGSGSEAPESVTITGLQLRPA